MKRIYLVDVSSLFFRAFYAVRPLTTPSGLPTNAIYGLLSMTLKLIKEEKPEYFVFCYDRKEPSFRKEIYPEYKANRSEMPEDLVPQVPYIKKLADLLGIPSVEVDKYEADDIIGTLATYANDQNFEVHIVSGDKDFGQLVHDHIYIQDTMKNILMGPKEVQEKWGVPPKQFIDFLALIGDSSDNIPGVHGIGPKGAQKLLEEHGNLEGIYKNIEAMKGATKEKLIKGKDDAFLSRKLATICTDIPISKDFNDYKFKGYKTNELKELLAELNFKSFEKTLFAEGAEQAPGRAEVPSERSTTAAEVKSAVIYESNLQALTANKFAAWIETKKDVWLLSDERGFYFASGEEIVKTDAELEELSRILNGFKGSFKGHDLKTVWKTLKIKEPKASWDSMLAAYLIKPGEQNELRFVVEKFTGTQMSSMPTPEELYGVSLELEKILISKMKEINVEKVFTDIDIPITNILHKMENRGILLDTAALKIQSDELQIEIRELEKKIHSLAGSEFNIGSPKQLSQILFEKLKLPVGKKTKTGFSTDNEVLEKLLTAHKIVPEILSYRELTKLKSTYVDALPTLISPEDKRLHTNFKQAHTATGRLSSQDPNLQNIPIKTARGTRVRKAFVAPPGEVLLSVDYSQIELRVLAHFSEDPGLIKAFENDLDIHTATAAEIFSVDNKAVTGEMRRTAKAVNFGIAYGQGAFGLAETLGIPRSEAQEIIKKYFQKFSRVQNYIEDTIERAKAKGYVETLCGRRRYMDELKSNNPVVRKFGERAAINAPIQGTASDIVKIAMIEVDKLPLEMILQVHDELIFEGNPTEVEKYKGQIIKMMEGVVKLKVPLKVNAAVGPNWDEAH